MARGREMRDMREVLVELENSTEVVRLGVK